MASYICVWQCIWVYGCTELHIAVQRYIYIPVYGFVYLCMAMCKPVYSYIYLSTAMHTYVRLYAALYGYVYICTAGYIWPYTGIYTYLCMASYICVWQCVNLCTAMCS